MEARTHGTNTGAYLVGYLLVGEALDIMQNQDYLLIFRQALNGFFYDTGLFLLIQNLGRPRAGIGNLGDRFTGAEVFILLPLGLWIKRYGSNVLSPVSHSQCIHAKVLTNPQEP